MLYLLTIVYILDKKKGHKICEIVVNHFHKYIDEIATILVRKKKQSESAEIFFFFKRKFSKF